MGSVGGISTQLTSEVHLWHFWVSYKFERLEQQPHHHRLIAFWPIRLSVIIFFTKDLWSYRPLWLCNQSGASPNSCPEDKSNGAVEKISMVDFFEGWFQSVKLQRQVCCNFTQHLRINILTDWERVRQFVYRISTCSVFRAFNLLPGTSDRNSASLWDFSSVDPTSSGLDFYYRSGMAKSTQWEWNCFKLKWRRILSSSSSQ